jgi:hypothetical protein
VPAASSRHQYGACAIVAICGHCERWLTSMACITSAMKAVSRRNSSTKKWERLLVGEQGIHKVWGFRYPQCTTVNWHVGPFAPHLRRPHDKTKDKHHPVWDSLMLLRDQGLLNFVAHLFDGDPTTEEGAELIYRCGIGEGGEPEESAVGRAANCAGVAMLHTRKWMNAKAEGYSVFIPVPDDYPKVEMVSVGRLRYRPHTTNVGQWHSGMELTSEELISDFGELRDKALKIASENGIPEGEFELG